MLPWVPSFCSNTSRPPAAKSGKIAFCHIYKLILHICVEKINSKIRHAALLATVFASNFAYGAVPKITTVITNGTVFQHFEIELSKNNVLLPADVNNRERLDDSAENFKYGQFEVFISEKNLKLPLQCKRNYIVRMPQTLNENRDEIERKQSLYYAIKNAKIAGKKTVRVVLEISSDPDYACNLFFRSDGKGRYVDYVGKIRP